jgi:1-acyl-sn-glycerol-3-phosphate acyltransferase
MRVWLTLIGCRVIIKGKNHFEKGKNYVVTFNHNTFMDVPLSCPFVPGGNKTIAKDSFAKYPIFGQFYSRGAVLVNRKNELSRRKSYEQMKMVLKSGMHMCLYPEGTRNRTTEPLKAFYDGAFKLAKDSNKFIIPCVLVGTRKAMPPHKKFFLLPTKLTMHFLKPVSPEDKSVAQLKEEVFQLMKEEYIRNTQ